MSLSFKMKVLLQDLKKCKHWFSYCPKTVLNDYTKEICAKQVATKNDFLMAFLHLEPLLIRKQRRRSDADQRLCFRYIAKSLFFLNLKFLASSHLLWLHIPVCVPPGRNPRRQIFFLRRGSNIPLLGRRSIRQAFRPETPRAIHKSATIVHGLQRFKSLTTVLGKE